MTLGIALSEVLCLAQYLIYIYMTEDRFVKEVDKVEIELKEIKQIELRILRELNDICESQGLRYSLCGGSLLGAIRHKGFIPWDDDIDVIMPRPDYLKFEDYCLNNKTGFKIATNSSNSGYHYLFAKLYDDTTILAETGNLRNDLGLGVQIDIFPVDGLGNTYKQARKEFLKTEFRREILVASNWSRFSRSRTNPWYFEPIRFFFFLLSRFSNPNKLIKSINATSLQNGFDDCEYCGCICGSYRLREIMERDCFEGYMDVEFEGLRVKCVKNYDKYLSHIYGDYMTLPPVEKRVSHHRFHAYYK